MRNSHNATIDESPKPFSNKVTAESYDFAVLTKKEFCDKYGCTQKAYEYRFKQVRNA